MRTHHPLLQQRHCTLPPKPHCSPVDSLSFSISAQQTLLSRSYRKPEKGRVAWHYREKVARRRILSLGPLCGQGMIKRLVCGSYCVSWNPAEGAEIPTYLQQYARLALSFLYSLRVSLGRSQRTALSDSSRPFAAFISGGQVKTHCSIA